MKNYLTLFSFLFASILSFGQDAPVKADLKITGFSAEVEAAMLDGDMPSYYGDLQFHNSMQVEVFNNDQRKSFHKSVEFSDDGNGHYEMNETVTIVESAWLSLQGEFEIVISVETILGNRIWTKVKRSLANVSEPIILDNYNYGETTAIKPKSNIRLNIANQHGSTKEDKKIKAALAEAGDSRSNQSKDDYHIMIKNEGETDWVLDVVGPNHYEYSGGHIKTEIPFTGQFDMSKPIVLRIEKKTKNGNMLWMEETMEPRTLLRRFTPNNFVLVENAESGNEEHANESGNDEDSSNETNSGDNDSNGNVESGNENTNADDESTGSGGGGNGGASEVLGGTVKIKEKAPEAIGATDLVTKTVGFSCIEKNDKDTVVAISGSNICLNGFKSSGSGAYAGMIAADCNFEIGGVIIPIKGGTQVRYNKVRKTLMEGVLRADLTYNTPYGEVILKSGSTISFGGDKLTAGELAQDTKLNVDGKEIHCKALNNGKADIRFDNQGKIAGCSLASAIAWAANVNLDLNEGSRLVFDNGKLQQVYLGSESQITIGSNTYNIGNDADKPSYRLNAKNELTGFMSGSNNHVEIEGQTVGIEAGSRVHLTNANGECTIEKIFAGEAVTINVYKGSKVKEVTVKKGKKIVFENGKVVKAG